MKKKLIKKLLGILIAGTFIISFSGCGDEDEFPVWIDVQDNVIYTGASTIL